MVGVMQVQEVTVLKCGRIRSNSQMDDTERLAADYLRLTGFSSIEYEPDGNVPPDLLADGKVAIEVRRLNQNFVNIEKRRGLEEDAIPLKHLVEEVLQEFGSPDDGHTWILVYSFCRPLLRMSDLKTHLRRFLRDFLSGPRVPQSHVELAECMEISLLRAESPGKHMFELGMFTDRNSGGWLLSELVRNLTLVIEEKSKKIEPYRSKYPIWWLLLADRIACGLSDHNQSKFLSLFSAQHEWDRIVLINPLNSQHAFVIQQH